MTMKKANTEKLVVAMGYFDSVHMAHREIISKTIETARELNGTPTVCTFTNNPYKVFNVDKKPLFPFNYRKRIIKEIGIENFILYKFNKRFADMSAEDFFKTLIEKHNIIAFVAGYDYTFGKDKRGNFRKLSELSSEYGIKCIMINKMCIDNVKIGTTAIEKYLSDGNVEMANKMLGRPYSVTGKVSHGRNVGERLGFPTANIKIPKKLYMPKFGVYATETVIDDKTYRSITNVGAQPTFNENKLKIETYIFDFDKNCYNSDMEVKFLKYLREIKVFENSEALKKQIAEDVIKTKEYFND